ncbi:MAG: hypothetical protein ACLU4I_02175, partial [Subdoligranulum sp.]
AAAGAVLKPQGGNCAVLPQQTQPDFVLAKDPLFSLLSEAPQELAQIEIGKGEPGIRGGAGGTKKANFAAKLRSVCAEDHKRAVKVYKSDRCQKENQE